MSNDDDLRVLLGELAEHGPSTPYAERMAGLRARRRVADRRRQLVVLSAVVAAVVVVMIGVGLLVGVQHRTPEPVGPPSQSHSRTHHTPAPPPPTGT